LCLEVADNGAGWNAAFSDKLFQPLERLDARRGGAGLGLAIAKAYVESAGGSIRAILLNPGASFVSELQLDVHPE
jgi:signal transduction histidine kinase